MVGTVQANEKGFGFFIPEDGSPDAFLPPHQMREILNGDTIKARVSKDRFKEGKFSAEFVSIVKRASGSLVGILRTEDGRLSFQPDDSRITRAIALKGPILGQAGQKVVVKITRWPTGPGPLEGLVDEVLGFPGEAGVDIKTVIRKYQWPEQFGGPVNNQVEDWPENPAPADWAGRLDLRSWPILTVDGADAKDFDDALSMEKDRFGNYRLGVHIADVSHYVREGTPLNEEATQRATSLYLADRVLPMLPHSVSDGLCSLNPGVPRLTMSVFLSYTPQGEFIRSEFAQSVIQSGCRGVYEEVQQVLDGGAAADIREKYGRFVGPLGDMQSLSRLIRRRREAQGSLDFDFPEVRAVLDPEGRVVDVRKKGRLESHRLIEDFMVAANEAVATHLEKMKMPAIYRIHEPPGPSDLEDLVNFLKAYRIPFKASELSTPKGLQSLIASVRGQSYESTISTLVLRSLKLAVYATHNAGHFGLALKSYCHFTSPIRRYPDLMVHRALKKVLSGERASSSHSLEKLALHCSAQERNAEKAERESQKVLQLRFMEGKIGARFEGAVRHLTPYGAFVELSPYGVEGFLPMESLGNGYQLDAAALVLRDNRGSQVRLGDSLKVQVSSVDMSLQRLTLVKVHG